MSNLKRTVLLTTLTLTAAILCAAQERKPEIVAEYHRFDDVTVVRLRPMIITKLPTDELTLGASFENRGNLVRPSDEASIHFVSISKEWRYTTDRSLILLIDGEQLPLHTTDYSRLVDQGSAFESMSVELSHKTLARIANAKKVEGRLGQRKFELSKGMLEGLKELARRMKQPQ
jgi:hypothetical protein